MIEAHQPKSETRRFADITRLIRIHVKASGPVSMKSIVHYVKWQYGETSDKLIHRAVEKLNENDVIEPYDHLTWW